MTRSRTVGLGPGTDVASSSADTVDPTPSRKWSRSAALTAMSSASRGQPPATHSTCSQAPSRHCSVPVGDRDVRADSVTSTDVPSTRGPNQDRAESGSRVSSSSGVAAAGAGASALYDARETERTWTAVVPAEAASSVDRVRVCSIARSYSGARTAAAVMSADRASSTSACAGR